jgi:ElaB/YqjD/DUF883 family membrane-anchored ribosome-binding protein
MNPNTTLDNTTTTTAEATRELHLAAHNSVRSLTDSAHLLSEQARHAASAVRDQALAAKERTSRYVAQEPMKAVLVAAAAGALLAGLAMFFGSRRAR